MIGAGMWLGRVIRFPLDVVLAVRQRAYAWRMLRRLERQRRAVLGINEPVDRYLARKAAEAEAARGPRTPADDLCDAAYRGDLVAVQRCLAAGTSPVAVNRCGRTPLSLAEEPAVVRTLLERGALR